MCMNIYNEFEVESKNKIYSKLQAALETNKYTITKRKDGRLSCRIPYKIVSDPETQQTKYLYKNIYASTKYELSDKRLEAIMDLLDEFSKTDDALFRVRLKNWLVNVKYGRIRATSYDRLECTLNNQIIPAITQLGDKKIYDVTEHDIDFILRHALNMGYSYSTLLKVYRFLDEFFKYQCSKDKRLTNPTTNMYAHGFVLEKQKELRKKRQELQSKAPETLKEEDLELAKSTLKIQDKTEQRFLSDDEIIKLKEAAYKKFKNGNYCLKQSIYFIFLLYVGLRAGEAVALKYRHIDYENKTAQVIENRTRSKDRDDEGNSLNTSSVKEGSPKTKQSKKSIVLSDKAIEILKELQAQEPEGYDGYIVNDERQPISPKALQKRFYNLLKLAGIEKTGLHTLRHTCASKLYEKTEGDTMLVSSQLRHSSQSFTADTYIHLAEKYKKRKLKDFEI